MERSRFRFAYKSTAGEPTRLIRRNATMATTNITVFIIGDSNVDRNLPKLKASEEKDDLIQTATMARATNLVQIQDALLNQVPGDNSLVVLAGLTNPVTSFLFEDLKTMREHCAKVFGQIKAWILEGRTTNPDSLARV
jgi:hypothetical protein